MKNNNKKQNLTVTVSERYRIPLKPERDSGLWVDRIGSGVNFKNIVPRELRLLGLYAAVGVKKGTGKFFSPVTGKIGVKENDVMLLFPKTAHYYYPDYSWDTRWVVWNGEEADKLANIGYFSPRSPIIKGGFPALHQAHSQLIELMQEETPTAILQRKIIVFNLLLELHKLTLPNKSAYAATVKAAVDYIDANLAKDLTLEDLAGQCGFSVPHFRRIFNAETGVSPKEFIISRKIAKAKEYLFARVPVKETADMLAFNDESYFRKVFKKVTGITPGQFK